VCEKNEDKRENVLQQIKEKRKKQTWKWEQQKLKKKIYQIEQLFLQTFLYERCRELYCKFFQYIFIFFHYSYQKKHVYF